MEPSAFLTLLGAMAYLLVFVSLIRILRIWLDWRDARALAAFRAQCLLAEAEALRGSADRSTRADAAQAHGIYGHPSAVPAADRHPLPRTAVGDAA